MPSLPTVPFGPEQVTRLICGGNPFCGNSHFSPEMSEDMREYFTAERVVETLRACQAAGINTLQARGDFHRILYWRELFRREGGQLHFIAQTASEMHDIFENIRVLAAAGTLGIYHHGSQTDRFWHEDRIDDCVPYLQCIRDAGVQVGLATHIPEVIGYAEEKGWDVDFYMACVYNLSRRQRASALVSGKHQQDEFLEEDPPRMYETIRTTPKTCLAFKILGASRKCGSQAEVRKAFRVAFDNIKPRDAVIVGMFPKHEEQARLNVDHALAALTPTD